MPTMGKARGSLVAGVLILGLLVLLGPVRPAQAADAFNEKIEAFFAKLKGGENETAIDFLYAGNPWVAKSSDALSNVKSKFRSLDELVGKYKSHQLLARKSVADRYVYLHYFVAFERQPLAFAFEFYRPDDTWVIQKFSFNDDLDDLVEKGVKENLFRPDPPPAGN